jgi:hypothetical protein
MARVGFSASTVNSSMSHTVPDEFFPCHSSLSLNQL